MKKTKVMTLVSLSVFVCICVILFFLLQDVPKDPNLTVTQEDETEETETLPVSKEETVTQTMETPLTSEHSHLWMIKSFSPALCEKDGLRVLSCQCGETIEEILPKLVHQFEGGTCISPSKCKLCGKEGEKKDHIFENARCISCGQTISSPIYALGTSFDFDEKEDSITAKLGTPTEILVEGKIRSLVYAQTSRLTVFQMDPEGLWGVFTMDPSAFLNVDGKVVTYSNFTGRKDPNSDATYQILGRFKIFGFRDKFREDQCYGLWVHYSDLSYHYMTDADITSDYTAQTRLSFYYVNALRSRHGLAPLAWSAAASQVSYNYSEKMAKENFFAHDYKCGERLTQAGVLWKTCGENLSQGYTNAFFVTDAYYNSKDHRTNILSEGFTRVGMGFYLKTDSSGPLSVLGAQTYFS